MRQPDIVKIIQRCETWSTLQYDESDSNFYVRVHFKQRADANAFMVELMMVASGQAGYEKESEKPNPNVCPECGGDCASANPPVVFCPMKARDKP